jgi:hypothetical protein
MDEVGSPVVPLLSWVSPIMILTLQHAFEELGFGPSACLGEAPYSHHPGRVSETWVRMLPSELLGAPVVTHN